jgi:hypothetical protein
MPTINVPRPDVTLEQVSEALHQGLGPRYIVKPGQPDSVVVELGSAPFFHAGVTLSRRSGQTELRVHGSGVSLIFVLVSRVLLVRKIYHVLQAAPGLR